MEGGRRYGGQREDVGRRRKSEQEKRSRTCGLLMSRGNVISDRTNYFLRFVRRSANPVSMEEEERGWRDGWNRNRKGRNVKMDEREMKGWTGQNLMEGWRKHGEMGWRWKE